MKLNYARGWMRAVTLGAAALTFSQTHAVQKDQVTFVDVIPTITTSPFNGTLVTHNSTVPAFTLGRIDFGGATTQINGCTTDWMRDNILYTNLNNFMGVNERKLSGSYFYTGTVGLMGSFYINPGMTAPFGSNWKFYFSNFKDDGPVGPDNKITITFTFTNDPVTPPPATTVNIDPTVQNNQELTYFANAQDAVWYKLVVAQPTSLVDYLDISTDLPSSDFHTLGLFDNTGLWIGSSSTEDVGNPGFSFGGDGYYRPPYAGYYGEGQDGSLAAGTYYLVVGPSPLDLNDYFYALAMGTQPLNGKLSFRTGQIVVPPSPPAPLYEQEVADPFSGIELISIFKGSQGDSVYDRQAMDDFTVPAPGWSVTHVGASLSTSFPFLPTHSVRVWIYPKLSGGIPGAPVASLNIPGTQVSTIFQANVGNLVKSYFINLGSPVVLPAGNYFLSVQPDQGAMHYGLWFSSTPTTPFADLPAKYRAGPLSVNDFGYPTDWTSAAPPDFPNPLDLAFAIYGDVSSGGGNGMTGTLDLGQLGGSPYNSGANLPTTLNVSYRDASNNEIATGTATYNPVTGAVSGTIPNSVNVPFRVSIKVGFWLRKTMPNPANPAAPLGAYNFGTVSPAVGDADDDNAVTPSDYGIWQVENGTFPVENTGADFDGDGAVTPSDYGLWQINNGAFGDD